MNGGNYGGGWSRGPPRPARHPDHRGFNSFRGGGQRQSRWETTPPPGWNPSQNQGNFQGNAMPGERGGGQNWPGADGFGQFWPRAQGFDPRNSAVQLGPNQQQFGGPQTRLGGPQPATPVTPPRNNLIPRPPISPSRMFRNPSPDLAVPSPLSEQERNEHIYRNQSPPPSQPCKKPRVMEDHPGVVTNLFEVPRPADPLTALEIHNSDEDEAANSDDSESTVVYPTSRNTSTASRGGSSSTAPSARGAPAMERRGSNDSNCSTETAVIERETPNIAVHLSDPSAAPPKKPQEEVSKSPPLSDSLELTELIKKKNIDVGPAQQNILRLLQHQSELAKKPSAEKSSNSGASKENDTRKVSDKCSPKRSSKDTFDKLKKSLEQKDSNSKHQSSSVAVESSSTSVQSKKKDESGKAAKNDGKSKPRGEDQKTRKDNDATRSLEKKHESKKKSESHIKNCKTNVKDSKLAVPEKKKLNKKSSSPSKKHREEKDRRRSTSSNDDSNDVQKQKRKNDSGHRKLNAAVSHSSRESSKNAHHDDGVRSKDVTQKGTIVKEYQHKEVLTDLVMGTASKSYEDKSTSASVVAADTMVQTERINVMDTLCQAVPEITQAFCQTEVPVTEAHCQTEVPVTEAHCQTEVPVTEAHCQTETDTKEVLCQTEINAADAELQTEFQGTSVYSQTEGGLLDQRSQANAETETDGGEIVRAPENIEGLVLDHSNSCKALLKKLEGFVESSKFLKPDQPEALRNSIRATKDLLDNFSRLCDIHLLRFEVANTEPETIHEAPHANPQVLQLETMANYFRLLVEMESADVSPEMRENKASLWNLSRLRIIRILRYGCGQKSPLHQDMSIVSILTILQNAFGRTEGNEIVSPAENRDEILMRCWDAVRNCTLILNKTSIDNEINNIKFEGFQRIWKTIKPKVLRKQKSTRTPRIGTNPVQSQNIPGTISSIASSSQASKGNNIPGNHHVEVTARTTEPGSYQLAIADTREQVTCISPPQCHTPIANITPHSEFLSNDSRNSPKLPQQGVTNNVANIDTGPISKKEASDNVDKAQKNKTVSVSSSLGKESGNNTNSSTCVTSGTPTTATNFSVAPVSIASQSLPNITSSKEPRRPAVRDNLQPARMQRPMTAPSQMSYPGINNYFHSPQIPAPLQTNNGFHINTYGNVQQQAMYPNGAFHQGYQNSGYAFNNPGGPQHSVRHPNSYNSYGTGAGIYGQGNQQNQFPAGPPFMNMPNNNLNNHNNFVPTQSPNGVEPNVAPFEGDSINFSRPLFFN